MADVVMKRSERVVAGLPGVVVAELGVLDYTAWRMMRDGLQMEVVAAHEVFEADLDEEELEEVEPSE